MKKIQDFFDEKARDRRFKKAGPGVRLADVAGKPDSKAVAITAAVGATTLGKAPAGPPPESQSAAARAAAARASARAPGSAAGSKRTSVLDSAMQQALLAEKAAMAAETETLAACAAAQETIVEADPQEAIVQQESLEVHFICSVCGEAIVRFEAREHGPLCLLTHMEENTVVYSASLVLISSAAEDVRRLCIDTLKKFINNIICAPSESKYRRISLANATVKARVASVDGAVWFLKAVGFVKGQGTDADGNTIDVLIKPTRDDDAERLAAALVALDEEPHPRYRLQRNVQVLKYSGTIVRPLECLALPDSFFQMFLDELREEQERRSKQVALNSLLRTRAMREKAAVKRHYAYAIVRVRWPNGTML
jgi:hypothetical protein